ncbi:uncharacterized, partial [Tachysurus ichikawai]
ANALGIAFLALRCRMGSNDILWLRILRFGAQPELHRAAAAVERFEEKQITRVTSPAHGTLSLIPYFGVTTEETRRAMKMKKEDEHTGDEGSAEFFMSVEQEFDCEGEPCVLDIM